VAGNGLHRHAQGLPLAGIAGAGAAPKLAEAEIERAKRKPMESLDAYDYYPRGLLLDDIMDP
jgi:hypothetical protein